jgi:hypothetical protein
MANELALPDDYAAKLMSGIAETRATTKLAGFGGKDLLRLNDQDGSWNFGQSNEDVQPGSRWAVNVRSLMHGYTCWVERGKKNELVLDAMVPVTQPKGIQPPPIEGKECKDTRAFDLKCLDGADKDTEVHYKSASDGCIRATDALLAKIYNQIAADKVFVHPVITLGSESYWNAKWNKNIHKPVFELVGWANSNGEVMRAADSAQVAAPEPVAVPVQPAAPARKRKPPLAAVPQEEPAPVAPAAAAEPTQPVSTVQARVGQRRRPVAR